MQTCECALQSQRRSSSAKYETVPDGEDDHDKPRLSGSLSDGTESHGSSETEAIFNLVNATLGAGVLG